MDYFFTDSKIHEIFLEKGDFNFLYQIPQILYSTIISTFINAIIRILSLTEKDAIKIKKDKINYNSTKKNELFRCLKIRFLLFFAISFILLSLFWYYLSCFGAIYINTQIHLLKDTLISFLLSLIYPLGIYLIPGIFRRCSLKSGKNERLYALSKIIQLY